MLSWTSGMIAGPQREFREIRISMFVKSRSLLGYAILGLIWQAAIAAESTAPAVQTTPASIEEPQHDEIPLDDIRVLVEVFHKIKKDYV